VDPQRLPVSSEGAAVNKIIHKPAKTGFSPQARAARNRSAMAKQRHKGFGSIGADTNFLLTCSDNMLAAYELARLGAIANLRSDLQEILDQLIDTTAQASLARWFRNADREALRQALETPFNPIEIAKKQIRRLGKSDEEVEAELSDILSLNPGLAHRTAAMTYQKRNIAEGKCCICPEPLDRNSVRYCEKHLRDARLRMTPSKGKPGSVGWLYGETEESTHGRQPGSLAAMAMGREQRTRALLAEAGLTAESAAVGLKAALEALMKCMPNSQARAMSQDDLFKAAKIPTRTTGRSALKELFAAGAVQRIGKGGKGSPFRFFAPSRLRSLAEKKRGS
jgi:hypothetical protein